MCISPHFVDAWVIWYAPLESYQKVAGLFRNGWQPSSGTGGRFTPESVAGLSRILHNAHHIRELAYVFEHDGQKWAQNMIDCLLEIKKSVDKAGERGELISTSLMRSYEKKYMNIVRQGLRKNPILRERMVKKRGRPGKTKIQNLLVRLRDYRNEVLAFMYDLDVPFDNNLAERDLRMIKVQQKISGLFRTQVGAEQFCKIRSYISTARKQGLNVIESIYQIMIGNQIYLNFAS